MHSALPWSLNRMLTVLEIHWSVVHRGVPSYLFIFYKFSMVFCLSSFRFGSISPPLWCSLNLWPVHWTVPSIEICAMFTNNTQNHALHYTRLFLFWLSLLSSHFSTKLEFNTMTSNFDGQLELKSCDRKTVSLLSWKKSSDKNFLDLVTCLSWSQTKRFFLMYSTYCNPSV